MEEVSLLHTTLDKQHSLPMKSADGVDFKKYQGTPSVCLFVLKRPFSYSLVITLSISCNFPTCAAGGALAFAIKQLYETVFRVTSFSAECDIYVNV